MRVTVKMFAGARDAVGQSEVTIELPQGATVADVRSALCVAFPQFGPFANRAMFAVDAKYAQDNEVIPANTEIACIPPVSGG